MGPRLARLLGPGLAAAALLMPPPPARADLLGPLLGLLRPQVERRLAERCENWGSGGDADLAARLRRPCRRLAGPTSRCLVEETSRSGRSLGVLSELLVGRLGDDGEVVIKRCLARLLGLPPDDLRELPLRDLERRFAPHRREAVTLPPPALPTAPGGPQPWEPGPGAGRSTAPSVERR